MSNPSVVILDDSKTYVSAAVAVLKRGGYDAVGACTLGELGECLQVTTPSLLLVDENMPEVLGHDLVGWTMEGQPSVVREEEDVGEEPHLVRRRAVQRGQHDAVPAMADTRRRW